MRKYINAILLFLKIMKKKKPFDLVIIESPNEYELASRAEILGLIGLAAFCREHQIPVRAHNLTATRGERLAFQEGIDDRVVAHHFTGSDYRNGLNANDLHLANTTEDVKILITGGMLLYDDVSLDKKVASARLDPSKVANYSPEDDSRRFALVKGCVAKCADYIWREMRGRGKKPEVTIDTKSTANEGNKFHSLKTYRFHSWGLPALSIDPYRILEILDNLPEMRRPSAYLFGVPLEGKSLLGAYGKPIDEYLFPAYKGLQFPPGTLFKIDPSNERRVEIFTP